VNRRRLLRRLTTGDLRNVRFGDMEALVEGFGFELLRRKGSHHVFGHPGVVELVNLQEEGGEAKPYQIRQFLKLVERYNLRLEDDA
jgi:predicted RNA binding protein YcfA (HicA-like mRNA interferase family)